MPEPETSITTMSTQQRKGARRSARKAVGSSARQNGTGCATARRKANDRPGEANGRYGQAIGRHGAQNAISRANRAGAAPKPAGGKNRPTAAAELVAAIVSGKAARLKRSTHRAKQLAAVMCDLQPQSPLLAIDYRAEDHSVAILCENQSLISGNWTTHLQINGEPVDTPAWSSSIWTSNAEADYLELCCELPQGGRIERGVMLGRADRFALLYDAVLLDSPAMIEVENRMELAHGIAFERTRANTEAVLRRGTKNAASRRAPALARLFPLALPEWRGAAASGELWAAGRTVAWSLSRRGCALFSPVWIDLDRGRSQQKLTWRQLTVGESLRRAPDDVAVGYRLAVGKHQWIVYRSLAARGNRTLLGHNLSTEMLVARFERDGEVDPLIEIE